MQNPNRFLDKTSKLVIAVDGEAASGKGTICKRLAREFNLFYCQSSVFYRKLARIAIDQNIEDIKVLSKIARDLKKLDSVNEEMIYSGEVSKKASQLASIAEIRKELNIPQKNLLKQHPRLIMEGRDIGTVIAPDADVKLYISASIEERSKRRFADLILKEPNLTLEQVRLDLLERDQRDKERKDAPLMIAKDAIVLDSSNMNAEEFYQTVVDAIIHSFEKI